MDNENSQFILATWATCKKEKLTLRTRLMFCRTKCIFSGETAESTKIYLNVLAVVCQYYLKLET